MTVSDPVATQAHDHSLGLAKRNAFVLAAANAFIGACAPIAISLGGIAGDYLLDEDKSLATAPVTGFNIGVALGALPAAWLMRLIGRRYGFMGGAMVSALGGLISAIALFRLDFWLFAAGLMVLGMGGAFVQQFRFAAADNAPEGFKAQAISWVLIGGIFAAIIGPQTVIFMRDFFAPIQFAGAYASVIGLAFIGIVVLSFLRVHENTVLLEHESEEPARPLLEIISQPRFLTALACGVCSFALMSFMMTGAPLAMIGCGFSTDMATLGIQWHVLAMFGPSFFTGKLIARYGRETIVATGLIILIGCAVVGSMGIELWNFWLALVLLGVGWNFGFIGATAMVTTTYRSSEKNKVQGVHDVILFGTVAFSSLMAGKVLNTLGWEGINMIMWPIALACLLLLGLQVRSDRKNRSAAA
ncbi:MFS transporter [Hoeflea prorocentri]|uniref:MFS transporter n=1 Tax=Hoeflea prorocentri TaxID=1922333 RepID=A0A9X3ZGX8_9HYPH|nr:MFS transporter [Hoeflea prorocentri]MCY6381237.1 MFS transporter [Hoeflea prorocentri]MDA5399037.1 MFS transporter [Hoeflea prorocentri]